MPTENPPSKSAKSGQRASLKLIFFYIVAFAALYTSIVSYLNLIFAYINWKFPDQLNNITSTSSLDRIRWATSILVVVWALYIFTQWLISGEMKSYKETPEKSGRKLLTHLTLLLSTITIAVDLITLIYNFYSGGFSTSFFLKIFSVFVIAAVVFGYYRWDLLQEFGKKSKIPMWSGIVVSVVLVGSVVIGFFIVGSPLQQRDIRFDERRISDLQQIQSQVIDYWQRKDKLPDSLAALTDNVSGYGAPTDPETAAGYKYKTTDKLSFEICANFKTSGDYRGSDKYSVPVATPYTVTGASDNWNYKAGETCFSRTIDPTLYKSTTLPTKD